MTMRSSTDYMNTSTFYVLSDRWPFGKPGAFIKAFLSFIHSFSFFITFYQNKNTTQWRYTHTKKNFFLSPPWQNVTQKENSIQFYLFVSLGNFLNGIDLFLWPHSQLERQLFIFFFRRLLLLLCLLHSFLYFLFFWLFQKRFVFVFFSLDFFSSLFLFFGCKKF